MEGPLLGRHRAQLGGYPEKELETIPSLELQSIVNTTNQSVNQPWTPGESQMPIPTAGRSWISAAISPASSARRSRCRSRTRLFLAFDEILTNSDVDFKRLGCVNIVAYELEPGSYELESFEPYTLRYLKLIVLDGDCDVQTVPARIRRSRRRGRISPPATSGSTGSSPRAARRSARTRWTCSWIARRASGPAGCATASSPPAWPTTCAATPRIEQNFFENFQLPPKFAFLPDGMLPMCYPGRSQRRRVHPELGAVVRRATGGVPRAQRRPRDWWTRSRPRVLRLFDFFKRYENDDGLLEKLPSWVFVEWSKANASCRT